MSKPWYHKFSLLGPRIAEDLPARAAASGPEAQNNLGAFYSSREGTLENAAAAFLCFQQAAQRGHAMAQNNLGLMCACGEGVPRDEAEAGKWFLKAASQGDAGAQFNLGVKWHRASLSLPRSEATEAKIEAYKWFHLAAAQGYRNAETSCNVINLQMTSAEVGEGNRRADAFVPKTETTLPPG